MPDHVVLFKISFFLYCKVCYIRNMVTGAVVLFDITGQTYFPIVTILHCFFFLLRTSIQPFPKTAIVSLIIFLPLVKITCSNTLAILSIFEETSVTFQCIFSKMYHPKGVKSSRFEKAFYQSPYHKHLVYSRYLCLFKLRNFTITGSPFLYFSTCSLLIWFLCLFLRSHKDIICAYKYSLMQLVEEVGS